jgi:hypothetical protein
MMDWKCSSRRYSSLKRIQNVQAVQVVQII